MDATQQTPEMWTFDNRDVPTVSALEGVLLQSTLLTKSKHTMRYTRTASPRAAPAPIGRVHNSSKAAAMNELST